MSLPDDDKKKQQAAAETTAKQGETDPYANYQNDGTHSVDLSGLFGGGSGSWPVPTNTETPAKPVPSPIKPEDQERLRKERTAELERERAAQAAAQGAGGAAPGGGVAAPATFIDRMEQIRNEYEAEKGKVKKGAKGRAALASISDAARALANLYYVSKGAQNAYSPAANMTPKAQERYDKALAELEAANASNLQYLTNQQNALRAEQEYQSNQRKLKLAEDELELNRDKLEWTKTYQGQMMAFKERANKLKEDYNANKISLEQYKAQTDRLKAEAKAKGMDDYTIETFITYGEDGKKEKETKVRTVAPRATVGSSSGGNGGGNGTTVRAKDNSAITF